MKILVFEREKNEKDEKLPVVKMRKTIINQKH